VRCRSCRDPIREDAAIDLDPDTQTVRVDWHGYALDQVDTWADRVVQAAWEHGLRYVEFVHGAADIPARGTVGHDSPAVAGRGTVKAMLRRRLYGGQWRRWAAPVREGRHEIREGSMRIALLDNPRPNANARWPVVPPPAHG
jgi:hypothetical protein